MDPMLMVGALLTAVALFALVFAHRWQDRGRDGNGSDAASGNGQCDTGGNGGGCDGGGGGD